MKEKITMIEAQKHKGRFNVYVNGKYAFPISESVMIKYRVFKGMEINPSLQQQLMDADEVAKLYSKAMDFLSHQLRTRRETVDKLRAFSDNDQHIDEVMQKLTRQNLINDQNYADSYVRTEVKKMDKGPRNVFYKLKQKGISEEYIENALSNFYLSSDVDKNCEYQAQKIFKKHHRDAFKKRLEKTKIALLTKGYATDSVLTVMDALDFDVNESEQQGLLNQQGNKIWHRNRRYTPAERVIKTKQALYRKGFNIDDINRFIEEQESN